VVATTWDGSNATGLWTFMILWVMRQSAKLNIFLGVRNLNESFLPKHLAYLHSYFRCQPMNPLFPASVLLSTIGACLLWQAALAPGASAFQLASFSLCASMLTLAVVEHWFMVLPLPSQALWNWGLRSRA
jgi:putative photosynthetic complex assembly protein 2